MLTDRRAVRIAIMRSTVHLVTAEDCRFLRPLHAAFLERALLTSTWRTGLDDLDLGAVVAAGRALVEEQPLTFRGAGGPAGGALARARPGDARPGGAGAGAAGQLPPRAVGPDRPGGRHHRRALAGQAARRECGARRDGAALPGGVRPRAGDGRAGVVGPHAAQGGDRPAGRPGAALPQRGGPRAARPARRPPSRPRHAGAGALPARLRQRGPVARRPQPHRRRRRPQARPAGRPGAARHRAGRRPGRRHVVGRPPRRCPGGHTAAPTHPDRAHGRRRRGRPPAGLHRSRGRRPRRADRGPGRSGSATVARGRLEATEGARWRARG